MKLFFPILLLVFVFRDAQTKNLPDTLTYWQVYLNGYHVKSFNENERNPTLTLELAKIEKDEKLVIKYFRDTPCANCPTHLLFYDDQENEILSVNGRGTFSSLTFNINKLIDKWNGQSIKYFEAYYWENNSTHHKLLFVLRFE